VERTEIPIPIPYDYLKSKGAKFPHIEGINDQPGIDLQPGYRQILAVDSEGNLINFSEYGEY
jgi:hypothetical protein